MGNTKSATIRAIIQGVIYELMPKSSVYNVYVDDETTLAEKLAEIIEALNIKVTQEELKAAIGEALAEAKANGDMTGPQGPQGPEGPEGPEGGYYLPSVQMSPESGKEEDTMLVHFSPSKEDMPSVVATEISLPRGPQGYDGAPGLKGLGIYRLNKELAGSAEYCYAGDFILPAGHVLGLGDMVLTPQSYLGVVEAVEPENGGRVMVAMMMDSQGNFVRLKGADGAKGETGAQGPEGPKGDPGAQGDPGVSPTVEIQGWGEVGEDDVERTGYELTITDKNGTKSIILMNGEQGPKGETGDQGEQGPKGDKGETGDQGIEGPQGVPGFSPQVSVEAFEETGEGGTRLTGNEITIVAGNGTQIFRVYNGADGKDGEDGVDGGGNGADQEPLVVTVEPYYETDADAQEVEVGYQVIIEDTSGPQDFVIRHGRSAYSYAREGGFTGTEEEFASLLAASGEGEAADWNAEEGEPGYILNKPVYMGESGADTVILAPMNLPFDGEDGSTFIFFEKIDCFGLFEEGKTYRLVCNGNAQNCTAELLIEGDLSAYRFTADIYTVIINKADDLNPAMVTLYTEDSSIASVPAVQIGIYGPLEPVQRISPLALPEGVPFRVEKVWTTILPNCQPVREDEGEAIFMTDACRNTPIAGETYEILWNGGKYHCLCQDASSLAPGALGLGDLTQMGLAGNGEPFSILILSPMAMVYNLESAATPILSIHGPAGVERMLDNGLLDLDWLPRYSAGEEYIPNTRVMAIEPQEISDMTLYTGALDGVEFDVSLGEKKPVVVEINGRRYRGVTYANMDSMWISATGALTAMLGGKFVLGGITSTTWRLYATEPGMYSVRVYKGEVSDTLPEEFLPESVDGVIIRSSTEGSTKKFLLTVDDSGTLTVTEVTE